MKKIIILLICISLIVVSKSSAEGDGNLMDRGKIGLTFSSFGSNDLVSFNKSVGGPGYFGDGFKTVGLSYLYKLNRSLEFETGLEYSVHKILIEPNLPLIYGGTSRREQFSIITIPAAIRVVFLKYLFINGGLFLGFGGGNSTRITDQNGIGLNLGLGLKYDFSQNFSIFVNPYTKIHSIIPFTSVGGEGRLIESGFKFGILVRRNSHTKI